METALLNNIRLASPCFRKLSFYVDRQMLNKWLRGATPGEAEAYIARARASDVVRKKLNLKAMESQGIDRVFYKNRGSYMGSKAQGAFKNFGSKIKDVYSKINRKVPIREAMIYMAPLAAFFGTNVLLHHLKKKNRRIKKVAFMNTPILDEIRKQASKQIIPLRGVGKTPGMLRRISNLQKGIKIKGRKKDDENPNT